MQKNDQLFGTQMKEHSLISTPKGYPKEVPTAPYLETQEKTQPRHEICLQGRSYGAKRSCNAMKTAIQINNKIVHYLISCINERMFLCNEMAILCPDTFIDSITEVCCFFRKDGLTPFAAFVLFETSVPSFYNAGIIH